MHAQVRLISKAHNVPVHSARSHNIDSFSDGQIGILLMCGEVTPSLMHAQAHAVHKDFRLPVHSAKAQHDSLSVPAILPLNPPVRGHCEVAPVPHPGRPHVAPRHACTAALSGSKPSPACTPDKSCQAAAAAAWADVSMVNPQRVDLVWKQ